MIIDFDNIPEAHLMGFKGGSGPLDTRNYADDKVKIMYSTLRPGATTGEHVHEGNCEVMYIIKGEITFVCDGTEETVHAGDVHYCPCGHTHSAENRTAEDAEFFAIVPETKL